MAVLFTIAEMWKQPKHPSKDEWIKKIRIIYIYNTHNEYYSAMKEQNLAICNNMCGMGGIILSEVSQMEKDKYCMTSLI